MHTPPEEPCMPPPGATTHAPWSNHAHTPRSNHACPPGATTHDPPMNRMTNRCKILPCPKLRLRAVKIKVAQHVLKHILIFEFLKSNEIL